MGLYICTAPIVNGLLGKDLLTYPIFPFFPQKMESVFSLTFVLTGQQLWINFSMRKPQKCPLHDCTHSLTHSLSPSPLLSHTQLCQDLNFLSFLYRVIFQNIKKIGTLKDFQLWLSNTYSYSNSQLLYLLLYSTYRSIFIAFFLFFAKILPTTIKMLNSFIYRFSKWQKS